MIKLKELLTESVNGNISPSDIYNFYFLFYYNSHEPQLLQSQYASEMEREYLVAIKNKYLITFKSLLAEQINKYISRGRVDPDFPITKVPDNASAGLMLQLMKKTFRSDMQRRNDVWNIAAQTVEKLENISNPKDMYLPINALNMVVHNTQSKILGKLVNGYSLLTALDACAKVDPKYYASRVSKDLRSILQNPE